MAKRRVARWFERMTVVAFLIGGPYSVGAQVTTSIVSDGTLGTNVTQATATLYDIDGGTSVGGVNLFHGFLSFNVGTGDTASFNGPAGIENMFSRVSGGSPSLIDGTLRSTIAGADLFLLNPYGVLFGPNSALDLNGSFHAGTADYVAFTDGTRFNVVPSGADALLSAAPVSAFGFVRRPHAAIDVMSPNLPIMPEGEVLSFVGGSVNLGAADGSAPGYVQAPGGRVNLVSVASAGEAVFDGTGFDVDALPELGDVSIRGGSIVDGKEVFVRGESLAIDEAVILPGAFSLFGFGPPPDGGQVNVDVRDDVRITGTGPEPVTAAPPGILAFAGAFDSVAAPADVADIEIQADFVSLSGFASIQTDRFGPGGPPSVRVKANTVTIENGSVIALFNFYEGSGGSLTVDAERVTLDANGIPGGAAGATGLLAQGLFHPIYFVTSIDPALALADSGTIGVNAKETLTVSGGAQITTDSRSFGNSDDIDIRAGNMRLSDAGQISAQSLFVGESGNVTLTAVGSGRIVIDDGFVVAANTFGAGDSGDVDVTATESVTIQGTASGIASQTVPPPDAELDSFAQLLLGSGATFGDLAAALGLDPATAELLDVLGALNGLGLIAITDLTPGEGGEISVKTPVLMVSGRDSAIDSSTAVDADAGAIRLDIGSLDLRDGAEIRSRSGLFNLLTGELVVGSGDAGKVDISATGQVSISGEDAAISTSTFGDGDGGDVFLSAAAILIANGGSVSAASFGNGLAGNITFEADSQIALSGGSVTTQATLADGGNITLLTPGGLFVVGSRITTSVESGVGGGGNIFIDPQFVVLTQDATKNTTSEIVANAFGGPGGNIKIVAGQFIATPGGNIVEASSAKSIDGTVEIDAPDTDVAAGVAVLPESFLDASALLRERCGAARAGGASSLVAVGRGGVPVDPDGYLSSDGLHDAIKTAGLPGGAASLSTSGFVAMSASACGY